MKTNKEKPQAWTRSNREEVLGLLWGILYFVGDDMSSFTHPFVGFMPVANLGLSFYYGWKDND